MAKIRSLAEISKKWVTVTPQRSTQYEAGVRAPLEDWETNTKAAEQNFELGIQTAVARKSFGKGVDRAGTESWKDGVIKVGIQRWGQGVAQSGTNYQTGFQPYQEVIAAVDLPPRFPRGDARNYARTEAIGKALHDAKVNQ